MTTPYRVLRSYWLPALLVGLLLTPAALADDQLAGRASWSIPTTGQVQDQVTAYLESQTLDAEQQAAVEALWAENNLPAPGVQTLERVAQTLATVDADARGVFDMCQAPRSWLIEPALPALVDESKPAFLRDNLRLYYGRWLAQQRLYDEAGQILAELEPASVVDPASLLFYQGASHHFLFEKEEGLEVLGTLLQRQEEIPRRYSDLARLMVADLQPVGAEMAAKLDDIARLMNDITRRLDFGRAGTRVREEQQDVLARLDELIKELEDQQQQGGGSSGSAGNSLQPSSPMQDSQAGGGTGPGEVDPDRLAEDFDWGALPEKERIEALQQMTQDFPAHYRDVIEEYYLRLARDRGER